MNPREPDRWLKGLLLALSALEAQGNTAGVDTCLVIAEARAHARLHGCVLVPCFPEGLPS